ncbi:MAG: UbiA prenyltransferase family protein [Phycisphaerales bacterium]|nr:UbiA prenyltransferase family protein [Phycisphaerales bacterium]
MSQPAPLTTTAPAAPPRPLLWNLLRVARPVQWSKSVFVLVGPMYALVDKPRTAGELMTDVLRPALLTAVIFALVSSACYVVNDVLDAPKDRLHPRKCRRPIASGAVTPAMALLWAGVLVAVSGGLLMAVPGPVRAWVGITAGLYALNVNLYSLWLKHLVVADVLCLSLGFVIRVFGGCAAVAIAPTSWLLNCTLFLAMFLSFGKRLGERRTMGGGDAAATIRGVHAAYTDELLRMAVVVTAVATLVTYAGYVQAREVLFKGGVNLLWFTMLPAMYAMLRCMVLLDRGRYDDPTVLASRDWPTQAAFGLFALITAGAVAAAHRLLG